MENVGYTQPKKFKSAYSSLRTTFEYGRLTSSVSFRADEIHLESVESERGLVIVDQSNTTTTRLVDRPHAQLVLTIRSKVHHTLRSNATFSFPHPFTR